MALTPNFTRLVQVHARENEDVVAAVLPEARELGFDLTVRPACTAVALAGLE